MLDNVISLDPGKDANETLKEALDRYQDVMIIGVDEGGAISLNTNKMNMADAVYILEVMKLALLAGGD